MVTTCNLILARGNLKLSLYNFSYVRKLPRNYANLSFCFHNLRPFSNQKWLPGFQNCDKYVLSLRSPKRVLQTAEVVTCFVGRYDCMIFSVTRNTSDITRVTNITLCLLSTECGYQPIEIPHGVRLKNKMNNTYHVVMYFVQCVLPPCSVC